MNTKKILNQALLSLLLISVSNAHAASEGRIFEDDVVSVQKKQMLQTFLDANYTRKSTNTFFARLETLFNPEKKSLLLQNFSKIFDGADGNRDCEQQALMNYRIIKQFRQAEILSMEDKIFLIKQMLITPSRRHNSFGFLVDFENDNGFSLSVDTSLRLKSMVAGEILGDTFTRLDLVCKDGYEEHLIETKNRFGVFTGQKGFCQAERVDIFLKDVKKNRMPLLLTIAKTIVEKDAVTLAGIDNILFSIDEDGNFKAIRALDGLDNELCIQISAVTQFVGIQENAGEVEGRISEISTNFEKLLRIAGNKTSLANGELIPDYITAHPSYQETLDIYGESPTEERMVIINSDKTLSYNQRAMFFEVNHIKCSTIGNARRFVETLMHGARTFSFGELARVNPEYTTKPRSALEVVVGKFKLSQVQPVKTATKDQQKSISLFGF